jgi:hypothetical protein
MRFAAIVLLALPALATAQPAGWKVYKSPKGGFEVRYPGFWTVRPFPNQTGVGLRPKGSAADVIVVSQMPKPKSLLKVPFDKYVRVAAKQEIQGYDQCLSAFKVPTTKGYMTTWRVKELGGGTRISGPLAYFPAKKATATIQARLEDRSQQPVFLMMLRSIKVK